MCLSCLAAQTFRPLLEFLGQHSCKARVLIVRFHRDDSAYEAVQKLVQVPPTCERIANTLGRQLYSADCLHCPTRV